MYLKFSGFAFPVAVPSSADGKATGFLRRVAPERDSRLITTLSEPRGSWELAMNALAAAVGAAHRLLRVRKQES